MNNNERLPQKKAWNDPKKLRSNRPPPAALPPFSDPNLQYEKSTSTTVYDYDINKYERHK